MVQVQYFIASMQVSLCSCLSLFSAWITAYNSCDSNQVPNQPGKTFSKNLMLNYFAVEYFSMHSRGPPQEVIQHLFSDTLQTSRTKPRSFDRSAEKVFDVCKKLTYFPQIFLIESRSPLLIAENKRGSIRVSLSSFKLCNSISDGSYK